MQLAQMAPSFRVRWVTAALALLIAQAARADEPPALTRARAAVWAGHLGVAIDELQPLLAPPPVEGATVLRAYFDRLQRVAAVEPALPSLYWRGGRVAAADAVAKLDGDSDGDAALAAYVRGLLRPIDQLESALRDAGDAFARKDWTAARLSYETVRDSAFADADARKLAAARLDAVARATGLLGPLFESLHELPASMGLVIRVVATFLMALLCLGLSRLASAWFGSRHEFAISSTTAGGGGDGKGVTVDAALTARLLGELRDIAYGPRDKRRASWEHQLDVLLPRVVGTQLRGELETLAENFDATQQLTLGALKVPMRALWTFCVELVFPRARFQWAGLIDREDGETRLTLTRRDRRNPFKTQVWYEVSRLADVERARDEVIQHMAYRIVLEVLSPALRPSRSAAAYCAYERAVRLLEELQERVESRAKLGEAKALLQQAIHEDPSLWQARLRLGIVLRKLGESDVAMALFDDLLRVINDDEIRLDLRYHRAVVEAQKGSLAALRGARTRIEDLCHELARAIVLERGIVDKKVAHLFVHESPVGLPDVCADHEAALPDALSLVNRLRTLYEGDDRLVGHRGDDVAHLGIDSEAVVTLPAARSLHNAIALANQLKQALNRHLATAELHHAATALAIELPDACDLPSLIALVNGLKSTFDRHLDDAAWRDCSVDATAPLVLDDDDNDEDDDGEPVAYERVAGADAADARTRRMLLYFYTRSFQAEICARMLTTEEVESQLTTELLASCRRTIRLAVRLLSQPPPAGADAHALNLARGLALFAEGRTLFERDNLRGARRSLARAVACLPHHPGAQLALASVYRRSHVPGSFAVAQSCIESALALDKGNAEAYEEYGKLLLREDLLARAVERLQAPVDEWGRGAADLRSEACFVLGVALARLDRQVEAVARIERALRMSRAAPPLLRWPPPYYWRKLVEIVDRAWDSWPASDRAAAAARAEAAVDGFAEALAAIEAERVETRADIGKLSLALASARGRCDDRAAGDRLRLERKIDVLERRLRRLGHLKREHEEHKRKLDPLWARLRRRLKDEPTVPVVVAPPPANGPVAPSAPAAANGPAPPGQLTG
jgi:tetratricopeptide (TPR) repeat protein